MIYDMKSKSKERNLPLSGKINEHLKTDDEISFDVRSEDMWLSVKIEVIDQDMDISFD